eukprot:7310492-Ditylum_brightwellii.AAC.1
MLLSGEWVRARSKESFSPFAAGNIPRTTPPKSNGTGARKLHRYCECYGWNKHGIPVAKQEEKGCWNTSHHSDKYCFRPPTAGGTQANIASKPDTKEEKLANGPMSVSFKDAVLKAAMG